MNQKSSYIFFDVIFLNLLKELFNMKNNNKIKANKLIFYNSI